MTALITVFKSEFAVKEQVRDLVIPYCSVVKESDQAYIYHPKPGKLMELLNFLRENKIVYGTHFKTWEEGQDK